MHPPKAQFGLAPSDRHLAVQRPPVGRNVGLGKAIPITIATIAVLDWVSSGDLDGASVLGIAVWVGAVLSALTFTVRRLNPQPRHEWQQLVLLAITAGATSSLVYLLIFGLIEVWPTLVPAGHERSLGVTMIVGFFDGDALFGFWALLVELPYRIAHTGRLERERRILEKEAELARIRAALEPHFVLNTLNTIAALVSDAPDEARRLIATLGDLLRSTMQRTHRDVHSVREEVTWLRAFAEILEARHYGRLTLSWHVDRASEACLLPIMLLQPLIENAVHHGALQRPNGGHVQVRIHADGEWLHCHVDDDGPGYDPQCERPHGRGLALVRQRVALEGDAASLAIVASSAGTRVAITLPRRLS